MADNTILGSRKFYKIRSLNGCFERSRKTIQNKNCFVYTGLLAPENTRINSGIENVDVNTILFVTASEADSKHFYIQIPLQYKSETVDNKTVYVVKEYQYKKINKGDTFLWVKNEFYPLSLNEISDIEEANGNLSISYSNGSNKTISLKNITDSYNAIYPIIIDDGNIVLDGIYIDEEKNIKTFDNSIKDGVINSYVEGIGNTSTANYQHIMGKYAKPDDKSIFIIGGGEESNSIIDKSKNLFTVGFDGTATAEKDVIIKREKFGVIYGEKDIKLSDIHDVVDEDWVIVDKKIIPEYGEENGRIPGFEFLEK